jgi:carbonic anhydrase
MSHIADVVVVACIDFRFQKFVRDWTDKNLAGKTFDFVGWAGATKNLVAVLGQIDISVRLHQIKQAVLIHHEECGAYGAESTPERHAQDLKKAQSEILAKYPALKVDLYYLHLDGTFEAIS